MKRLVIYGAAVAALVLALWLFTKDGMRPDEESSIPMDSIAGVSLQSALLNRRVLIEDRMDIERLTGELNRLSEGNGVWVDREDVFPEQMKDWELEWLSVEGKSLALVEINSRGRVFRGDQCFNFLGGDIFDLDYLTGLVLLGEEFEPE